MDADICCLAEPASQTGPTFQTLFKYTRLTAKATHKVLRTEQGWTDNDLPCVRAISNILNRLGYRLRRVQKSKSIKKIEKTDDIFDNLTEANRE
ncbi:hypothetical protein BMR02_07965 [Methylococcaceae bacterium HT1]|uniref:ISAzo13-like element transposase-related protein n=1 Tax=Bathymodiolus platifrons methanotrophic gill symbiont TaxID=113268 RepID=UPI0011C79D4D|nr:hypothetical protein BMR02_07965 [Methylococcaceae bacterium HT1]TXL16632.1 hypothetical protein BMR04_09085 [Methylococcaceae bacterium HT3]TXL19742.1 hypothetical protein BMR06_08465 [Methylococcaceae bacterium HT5]TXL22246.1 hypothetical protein BMR03_09280 [Methylococcaceae bacterium HT2]